ncbi:hypothetical protein [Streptomyces sp. KL116D]|uniref:hypothetical protein n=1 Tax=Streptomyces sp. KL116D TaxID=3045152 RepID=UPI003556507E
MALLADDVTAYFDGGGKVRTQTGAPSPAPPPVARSLLTLLSAPAAHHRGHLAGQRTRRPWSPATTSGWRQ